MATNTMIALDKITVGTAVSSVTFSSIPSTYTDLVLEMSGSTSGSINNTIRVGNGSVDTGSNYSCTILSGNGSTAVSTRRSNDTSFQPNYNGYTTTGQSDMTVHFQQYANTSVYKPILSRSNNAATGVDLVEGTWRSFLAINTIQLLANGGYNWQVGSTFSLYGIKSEANGGGLVTKASGGIITSDSTYWYHTFLSSGTFTPTQSLTADALVIAGGAGGCVNAGGGGGAGGVLTPTSMSLTATGYTVIVGAAGASTGSSYTKGGTGGNSVFNGNTSIGGGGGGSFNVNSGNSGGSGGGGGGNYGAGGAGTSGQGYAGNNGSYANGGNGGGAGAVGGTPLTTFTSWASATGTGVGGYYAGGGAGSGQTTSNGGGSGIGGDYTSTSGTTNTGSGGGGKPSEGLGNSGAGGSGVVIIRYAK